MPTYDELLADDLFADSVYHVYSELGEDVPATRKEMVDDFLSKKRYFEDNLLGTYDVGSDLKNLSDTGKTLAGYAFQQTDALPTIFEKGSAPVGDAVIDHLLYSVADPTNLVGLIAGAFSAGTGGAAVLGGKAAVQQGVTKLLSNRAKAALGTFAVDSIISGTGGAVRENEIQNVEQDLNIREDKDVGKIVQSGLLEGPAAVAGGVVLGLGARGAAKGTGVISKKVYDALPADKQMILSRAASLAKSGGGVDEDVLRSSEIISGAQADFAERAQNLSKQFTSNPTYKNLVDAGDNDLLRGAFEGRQKELDAVSVSDPALKTLFKEYRSLIDDAQTFSSQVTGVKPSIAQNFDKMNPKYNPFYTRLTYDAFEKGPGRKIKFNEYIKDKPTVLNDLYDTIRTDALLPEGKTNSYYTKFGLSKDLLKANKVLPESYIPQIKSVAKNMYEGKIGDYNYSGALTMRRKQDAEFPKVFQELFGKNADPASTVFASVRGIIEPMSQLHMANEAGRILEKKGQAIFAESAEDAAAKILKKTGKIVDPRRLKNIYKDTFPVKNGLRGQKDAGYFVDDVISERMRLTLTNPSVREVFGDGVLAKMLDTASFIQGSIKLGKTAYSPVAHGRNVVGAGIQLAATGNLLSPSGIRGAVQYIKNMGDEEFSSLLKQLGITDTSATMRQIINRLGPDFEAGRVPTGKLRKIVGAGSVGQAARTLYQKTDDVSKIFAYSAERERINKIWDEYTPARQKEIMDAAKKVTGNKQITENMVLNEQAARRTLDIMPVYSRVPKFTEYLRGFPVVGNFMAHSLEIIRNSFNVMRIAHDEMAEGFATGNKALIQAGAGRLAAITSVNAGVAGAAYAANELYETSDIREALTSFLPAYQKFSPIVVLPPEGTGKDRKFTFFDLGYLNPFAPLMQLGAAVQAGAVSGESFEDAMSEYAVPAFQQFIGPIVDPSLASQALGYMFDIIKDPSDAQSAGKFIKLIEPGFAKLAREYATEMGAFSPETEAWLNPQYYGTRREEIGPEDTFEFLGRKGVLWALKKETFDIDATVGFALRDQATEYNKQYTETATKIKTLLENPQNNERTDYKQIFKDYEDSLANQFAVQANIADLLDDLQVLAGGDKSTVRQIMNDPDLRGAIPRSQKEKGSLLYDRSAIRRLSTSDQFWRDIAYSNPSFPVGRYRNLFNQLEARYDNKNLESPPDPLLD